MRICPNWQFLIEKIVANFVLNFAVQSEFLRRKKLIAPRNAEFHRV
jgi:hypothetical protein